MKKLLVMALVLSLGAMTITGCSSKPADQPAAPAESGTEAPAEGGDAAAEPAAAGKYTGEKLWPDGTPTVYVGYAAGGGTDTAVRPVVAAMAEYLGENINCTNMEGANSSVACDYVLKEAHNGYSMFATGTGGFSSFSVYKYSASNWQDWISFHAYSGAAIVFVNKDSGLTTIKEVMDFLGQGNKMGVAALGNGPHTQFEAICAATGTKSPEYSLFGTDGDVATAVIAGDVKAAVVSMSAVVDYIDAKQVVPIVVTSKDAYEFKNAGITTPSITTEMEGTENIPNLNETWPIMIPRDTPQNIVDALTEAFNYALTTDKVKEFAASKGFTMQGLTGEEADKFMSYSISAYAWTIYNAGLADGNPADAGIPTLEEYDWETLKATVK